MLLAPVWRHWPRDQNSPDPPSQHGVRPCRWAVLGPGSDFTVVPGVMGPLPSSGCPGSTPGCRQQHHAWVPPCMAGSWRGEQTVGAPRQQCRGSTLLVPSLLQSAAPHPASPQPLPATLGSPKLPLSPHSWEVTAGSHRQGPRLQPGAAFAALPQHRRHRQRFAAALPAPRPGAGASWGGRLAGSGCAD